MAGTTPLTIGADVSCTDGVCGKLSRLVIDPRARTVTHLVVNDRQFQGRLVPLNLIASTPRPARSGSAAPSRSSKSSTRPT